MAVTAFASGIRRLEGEYHTGPIAASTSLYRMAMVMRDSAGRLKNAATATGCIGVGVAAANDTGGAAAGTDTNVWNNASGSAAAFVAKYKEGVFGPFANSGNSIAAGDEGKACYIVDNVTVHRTHGGRTRSPAGKIHRVTADGVYVYFDENWSRQIAEADADDAGIGDAATELTIASGVVTITQDRHTIDTEGDAASDDLDTISGGTAEQVIYLRPANAARTVVLKHNVGNIFCPFAEDISLAESTDGVMLLFDGSKWIPLGVALLAKLTAAQVALRFGTDSFTSAVLLQLIQDGAFAAAAANRALFADKFLPAAKANLFVSTEQTGTGSSQNIAHGLTGTPTAVLVVPTEHPGTPDTGAFDIAEGAHDGTNVVVTVTLNVKFKVFAWV